MTMAVFYTLNRQCVLGDTTHKIPNISNITQIILKIFYLSPDDIKSNMKIFFLTNNFSLLPVLGLILFAFHKML